MAHAIDVSKGGMNSTVSNQWATRPDDQRFLSLDALRDQVALWRAQSHTADIKPKDILAITDKDRPGLLRLAIGEHAEIDATHIAFDQVCALAGVPSNYARKLPPPLSALNINYGLASVDQTDKSAYLREDGGTLLRGITSPRYGRIFDEDVVKEVQKIAGAGTGDADWKIPGCIEWGSGHGIKYNPNVEPTKDSTTLYASDRDLFLFLCDDTHPIEVGKLASGDPDLIFRGFYAWNSEVGLRTFGVATMYLRGVCQNRNLWGVENFSEMTFKHTSGAPEKFATEAAPALLSYAQGSTAKVVAGVAAAKAQIVSKTDEDRIEFLARFGFSEKQAKALIGVSLAEEGHPQESVWDHAQAITAQARSSTYQDQRLAMEAVAGKMLDKVKV